jgi:transposase InsO family protein
MLTVTLVASTSGRHVKRVLQRLFREHGMPRAIQCDNGTPWVSVHARGGLTKLSVWLLSLGVRLVRSRVGCPQDNGGHERMHRDLGELQLSQAKTRSAQQRDCDRWMVDFNHVRPHAALGDKTPAEVYRPAATRATEFSALRAAGYARYIDKSTCAEARAEAFTVQTREALRIR